MEIACTGANLSFRRKVFDSIGLFETGAGRRGQQLLSGEDTGLVRRIVAHKGKVVYDPDVYVEHVIGEQRLRWQYFIKRAHADGLTKEILDPKASRSFQFLRVCRAAVEYGKACLVQCAKCLCDKNCYERKLAQFIALRERNFLAAGLRDLCAWRAI